MVQQISGSASNSHLVSTLNGSVSPRNDIKICVDFLWLMIGKSAALVGSNPFGPAWMSDDESHMTYRFSSITSNISAAREDVSFRNVSKVA